MSDTLPTLVDADALAARIASCMSRDQHRLSRALRGARDRDDVDRLAELADSIERSAAQRAVREAAQPRLEFDSSLPINQERERIEKAIRDHQIIILCGETGSGKTTQLPKICMAMGRGRGAMIGHTQPRRIAARTVAGRIASEVGCAVGAEVGYQVRFVEQVGEGTFVKVMTDGVLLAELSRDRYLNAYDTLIIDEAHERSLNIDFILGYLKRLAPRRPDLKIIITSATIDPQRFAAHFDDAPVLEVSGRTFPVDVRYRPPTNDGDFDVNHAIGMAVREAERINRGDVLVFLPGEREIRDAAAHLRQIGLGSTDVLPLYGRLNLSQQAAIFDPGTRRRVVLATNVAETSVTVPNIRFVVDTGVARISRYSYRSKVQSLPVEPISQASADQRKGRCGRVAPGICFRLYAEDDFSVREEFTSPEIQRTNLAAVILQMKALGLGGIEDFPFIDSPDPRVVKDGYRLLRELGALDSHDKLTKVGRQLSRLPLDPRIGRILIAAREYGCVSEALTIAAGLSINDPRERPMESREAADRAHGEFTDKRSDFMSWLNLWTYFRVQASALSRSKLKTLCDGRYLNHSRLREWADVRRQLKAMCAEMGIKVGESAADYEQIHRALLTGFAAQVGTRHEEKGYRGTRGSRFYVFPASGVKPDGPAWVMAASLTHTRRLYAHTVARVEPEWIEVAGGELVSRRYVDPRFQSKRGEVVATEVVNFLGLQLVGKRTVAFARLDPVESREVFIREALALARLRRPPAFLARNMALMEHLGELEHKLRRGDLLADERALVAFYASRIGPDVNSDRSLRKWLGASTQEVRAGLIMTESELVAGVPQASYEEQFPGTFTHGELVLPLAYKFEPGSEADGVTVMVPLAVLNQLRSEAFEWLVPGLLEERVLAMLRSLPKRIRRTLVPLPDFTRACVESISPAASSSPPHSSGPSKLTAALAKELTRMVGVEVPPDAWREDTLPVHLTMRFCVLDAEGEIAKTSRDLAALKAELGDQSASSFTDMLRDGSGIDGAKSWDFGELPDTLAYTAGGVALNGFPALVDQGDAVGVRVFQDSLMATQSHAGGLARLSIVRGGRSLRSTVRRMPQIAALSLLYATTPVANDYYCELPIRDDLGPASELADDLLMWAAAQSLGTTALDTRDGDTFEGHAERAAQLFGPALNELEGHLVTIIHNYQLFIRASDAVDGPGRVDAVRDAREQMSRMVHRRFIAVTPLPWLANLARYINAASTRLRKLDADARIDSRRLAEVLAVERPCWKLIRSAGAHWRRREDLVELRWMLEELRVSVFAQDLGTRIPVSPKRVERALKKAALRND